MLLYVHVAAVCYDIRIAPGHTWLVSGGTGASLHGDGNFGHFDLKNAIVIAASTTDKTATASLNSNNRPGIEQIVDKAKHSLKSHAER